MLTVQFDVNYYFWFISLSIVKAGWYELHRLKYSISTDVL